MPNPLTKDNSMGKYLLLILGKVDSRHLVRQPQLLEQQRDLDTIGRLGRVQMNVAGSHLERCDDGAVLSKLS